MKHLYSFFLIILCNITAEAQITTFTGCDYSQGIVFIMEDNQIVWQHPAPESNDIWLLSNGNILFTTGKGVLEMTRQNDTVFHYSTQSNVFACQRLENGNTFIGECQTGRLLEITPDGTIKTEICILPDEKTSGGFGYMRNARRLENGNYLVAHYGDQVVKEYTPEGKTIRTIQVPGGPHSLLRLPNGNTLITVADMTQNPRIIEIDKENNCIWEFSNNDIPGSPLKFLGGLQHFANGNILFTNWTGHEKPENKTHLFLINKQKEVLFTQKDHPGLQTMSSVHINTPGSYH